MVLCLNYKKAEKMSVIKLADDVTKEDGIKFLNALDLKELYSASLCEDNGIIIHKLTN